MSPAFQEQMSPSVEFNANELLIARLARRSKERFPVRCPRESVDSKALRDREIALRMGQQVSDPNLLRKLILA